MRAQVAPGQGALELIRAVVGAVVSLQLSAVSCQFSVVDCQGLVGEKVISD